jgi:hypothetical protein
MENKTALQQLIFEIENTVIGNRWHELRDAMLELEKQQLIEAFYLGTDHPNVDPEQFYQTKYNSQK